jgi:hypothetical protein
MGAADVQMFREILKLVENIRQLVEEPWRLRRNYFCPNVKVLSHFSKFRKIIKSAARFLTYCLVSAPSGPCLGQVTYNHV